MFDKPNALQTAGLELESQSLKCAQLSLKKGKPALDSLFETDVVLQPPTEGNVNPLYISKDDQLKRERENLQSALIVTALHSRDVLVRPLDIKLKKDSDIEAVLAFQAEPLLPYPVENAVLDSIKIGQNQEGTQLTLIAARKDHLQQHLATWNSLQVEPEIVSCVPIALTLFSNQFCQSTNPHFVIHLGEEDTTCILINQGKLLAAQAVKSGLNNLKHAHEQDLSKNTTGPDHQIDFAQLDFGTLDSSATPLLCAAIDSWRREITRLLYALAKQCRDIEIPEALITGSGATCLNLATVLCQQLQKQLLTPTEDPLFPASLSQIQQYAVPIGAALSGLPTAKDQVNFRQQEFAYPRPWKRLIRPLAIYMTLCIGLAVAIYFFGNAYLSYREDHIRKDYIELLSSMNKSYATFEKEYQIKHPYLYEGEGELTVNMLTPSDISDRLEYLQKELKENPTTFPLQPNIPRVTDVLAWLSKHPKFTGKDADTSEGLITPLQIDNFSYTLVKRPEIKKPQEKYQVKIEMEFTSPTPKQAREFHDALIAPNDFVDPKGEVKWSSNRGKYRTSFFLKDRTTYSGG